MYIMQCAAVSITVIHVISNKRTNIARLTYVYMSLGDDCPFLDLMDHAFCIGFVKLQLTNLCSSCLQVEPSDDNRGNDVSDILHNGDDIVTDSGVTTVKQVIYLTSCHLRILLAFSYILSACFCSICFRFVLWCDSCLPLL